MGRRDTYSRVTAMAGASVDVHTVRDIDPGERTNISFLLAVACTQAASQSVCLNDAAPMNMAPISMTLETSHFEISLLKDDAL